jgi:hypothetical protein
MALRQEAWVRLAAVRQPGASVRPVALRLEEAVPLPAARHEAVAPLAAQGAVRRALQRAAQVWVPAQREARDAAVRLRVAPDAERLPGVAPDAELLPGVTPDAAAQRVAVLDAEALRAVAPDVEPLQEGRGAGALPLALVFRRDQALPWLVPSPSARFARAMAGLRVALP